MGYKGKVFEVQITTSQPITVEQCNQIACILSKILPEVAVSPAELLDENNTLRYKLSKEEAEKLSEELTREGITSQIVAPASEKIDNRTRTVVELTLMRGLAAEKDVNAAMAEREKLLASGEDVPLEKILLRKGFLTQAQVSSITQYIDENLSGERFGDFEILKKLGQGGMGSVYKARQISMDRLVALKFLPPHLANDKMYVERFYREARISAKVDHSNIVRGLAVGEIDGQHYFAMEYVEGESLQDKVDKKGPLSPEETVNLMKQMAMAMMHAEEKGLVHRDIKPDNILITSDGTAKLVDLGLAKLSFAQMTRMTDTGTSMGTPYYMAPEQARDSARADNRSDIYSLGITFYFALTGRVPYEGSSALEIMLKHETDPLPSLQKIKPGIPHSLSRIIEKMVEKKPEKRYQNAAQLLSDLSKVTLSSPAREVSTSPKTSVYTGPVWYVKMGRGEWEKVIQLKHSLLLQAIEKGEVAPDTLVSLNSPHAFALAASFPKLKEAFDKKERSKLQKVERAPELARFLHDIEAKAKSARRRKKIIRILKRIILLGILVAAGIFAYQNLEFLKTLISKMFGK